MNGLLQYIQETINLSLRAFTAKGNDQGPLGIGKIAPTAVAQEDGGIGIQQRCMLTLSVDHRISSGKYAGEFLSAIVEELESV